jgi:hypothetical protein
MAPRAENLLLHPTRTRASISDGMTQGRKPYCPDGEIGMGADQWVTHNGPQALHSPDVEGRYFETANTQPSKVHT